MHIKVNGKKIKVEEGSTLASALLNSGFSSIRSSIKGTVRAPLCGMGICYECRAIVDGVEHERTCMILCREGLEVEIYES